MKRHVIDMAVGLVCVLASLFLTAVATVLVMPFKGTKLGNIHYLITDRGFFLFLALSSAMAVVSAIIVCRARDTCKRHSLRRLGMYCLVPLLCGLGGTIKGMAGVTNRVDRFLQYAPDSPHELRDKLVADTRRQVWDTSVVGAVGMAVGLVMILASRKKTGKEIQQEPSEYRRYRRPLRLTVRLKKS